MHRLYIKFNTNRRIVAVSSEDVQQTLSRRAFLFLIRFNSPGNEMQLARRTMCTACNGSADWQEVRDVSRNSLHKISQKQCFVATRFGLEPTTDDQDRDEDDYG